MIAKLLVLCYAIVMMAGCNATDSIDEAGDKVNYATALPGESAVLITHNGFTISYLDKYLNAEWVTYVLTKANVLTHIPRTDEYTPDPKHEHSATREDYRHSGYDRGHLFPAANSWTQEIMEESFYYTNISPQNNDFNSGVWNRIENLVRNWAIEYDTIHVVTGQILHDELKTIGSGVKVPEYLFKVVVVNTKTVQKGIAFLVKNEKSTITDNKHFAITIDALEAKTGMDFCVNLPEDTEKHIEQDNAIDTWSFRNN